MFPTFISILDIQSWWEVPSIAHFCSLFRTAFNLLDFDIEDLEEALLTDGTEEYSWLQDLIVRLLSGCLKNNGISTFNYQMFLRRLFRQKCQEHDRYNPFNTDIDFQLLPLRTKVDILHALCDFRLDATDVLDQLKNLEADSLRVEPLGYDSNDSAYWYFYGTRLYREDFASKNDKKKTVWQVICFTQDDWLQLTKKFKKSTNKAERQLHHTLSENFLPELPRLFKEKEILARKRLLARLPKRSSDRLKQQEKEEDPKKEACPLVIEENSFLNQYRKEQESKEAEAEVKRKDLETRRQEAYERRIKLRENKECDALSETSVDEMAGTRSKKAKKVEETKISKSGKKKDKQSDEPTIYTSKPNAVGRQTNNSLSAATGQIVIEQVKNPHKKKLKTSQVFRQTDEDLLTGMHKILDYVKNHEDAWPFTDPVEEEYAPNYYTVIRKPMDLQRMEERLDSGFYKSFDRFRADFQLIVDNCKLYNGAENEYTEMVDNLLQVFEKATEKYLDHISSSDDEIAIEFSNEEKVKSKNRSDEPINEKTSSSRRKPMLVAQTDRKRERSESEESISSVTSHESPHREVNTRSAKHRKIEPVEETPEKISKAAKSKKEKDESKVKKEKEVSIKKENEKNVKLKNEKVLVKTKKEKEEVKTKKEKEEVKTKKEKEDVKTKKEKEEVKTKKEKEEVKTKKEKEIKPKNENEESKKIKASEKKNKAEVKEKETKKEKYLSKKALKNKTKKGNKKDKKKKGKTKTVSRSPSLSPPPSDSPPPSSPDIRFDFFPRTLKKPHQYESDIENSIQEDKHRTKFDKFFDDFNVLDHHFDQKIKRDDELLPFFPKPKEKHNKLRETIEKLKALSENKLKDEFDFELDHSKENKDKSKKVEKEEKHKTKNKEKSHKPFAKEAELELEEGNNTMDSIQSDGQKTKKSPTSTSSNIVSKAQAANFDALTIATEQTLKDINKWLDDTPKFAEFSSASNSPSYAGLDDLDTLPGKIDQVPGKKLDKPLTTIKKDAANKDPKKKPFRDPSKFFKRREVQRTIDRLQPGKSKGNLISNVQATNKADEVFALGPLSKLKDTKNSLIVKTNTNAPKLSLGSVLDSFGKHKFVDDQKKEEKQLEEVKSEEKPATPDIKMDVESSISIKKSEEETEKKMQEPPVADDTGSGGATPNLSAWFKAFGAPKIQPVTKRNDAKSEVEKEKNDESKSVDVRKVAVPLASPSTDTHGQPVSRQRRISTGSSMSERSSFSQDMDSPRVGMDERGAYPAPYPSPLHRSPTGASPIMASPRPDISPKTAYSTINGQIRVGFYQDTVSNKSSPDKSCSPRENSQSPYPHYSEHVYTPNTTDNSYYSYTNPPYYTHVPNYSSTNPTPPYNSEGNYSFYDSNKAQTPQNYTANSPASNHSSPHHQLSANVSPNMNADRSPGMNSPSVHSPSIHSPTVYSPHSPTVLPQHSPNINPQYSPGLLPQPSPGVHPQHSPGVHPQHSPGGLPQHSPGVLPQHSPGILPQHSPGILPQHSPGVHPQHSPGVHSQHSPGVHPQHSPGIHPQHSPGVHPQHSPGVHPQHSPGVHPQHSPGVHPQHSPGIPPQPSPGVHSQHSSIVQRPPSPLSASMCSNSPEVERFQPQEDLSKRSDKIHSQAAIFPVKKRAYNDNEILQISNQKFEIDPRLTQQIEMKKNQDTPKEKVDAKPYVHQNIPDPKSLNIPNSEDFYPKPPAHTSQLPTAQATSAYNFNTESNYSLNIPNRDRTIASSQSSKIDMSKYTNMGYTGPDVNTRSISQLSFPSTSIPATLSQKQASAQPSLVTSAASSSDMSMRYGNPNLALQQMGYKGVESTTPQQAHTNYESSVPPNARTEGINERLSQMQNVSNSSMSRSNYSASSVDVSRTMANLSHIVDRFSNEERVMVGLQNTPSFYGDKGLSSSHILNKPISSNASAMPIFSQGNMAAIQSYNQNLQASSTSLYNRPMADLQNAGVMQSDLKNNQQIQEKKSKKRKSSKNVPASSSEPQQQTSTNQGFQSYAGLKGNSSLEPSAISLKTSSVVPGSAFNFGPTPAGLGIGSGLYADKDAYSNFLDEFRSTPNYYIAAAAAAHHRTPENAEKQTRPAHQNSNPQTYPFLGAPHARSTYPIAGPFIPNAQAQLMDTSSPLYQHYLQAGVLNQSLLQHPGSYPPGYHSALSMRQPYDSMNRPPWL
ncbi:uncharacterized protein dikar [Diabrotica undecimpunctata]|uniref:uncharacterized protein dikar n=1 Tax=Diabrotica undecimpunctata TaxID=50387 RepID=UPI003B6325B7